MITVTGYFAKGFEEVTLHFLAGFARIAGRLKVVLFEQVEELSLDHEFHSFWLQREYPLIAMSDWMSGFGRSTRWSRSRPDLS